MIDELDDNAREKILNIFLDLPNCWITLIIKLESRTEKNSTYAWVSWVELTCKDKRLTRNFRSSTSTCTITPSLSQVKGKATHRRGKRGSRKKKKEAIKEKLSMIRRKTI